ncbi:hypothetical protein E2C01_059376 [Portunus trituberculatus]|uniref:Uncharacterized protein n=1 Tax=Portunus trituberculatus TaxID=210409 RepID=A0A5B7H569_PORTR|nr:hypothetical protein [Portunus trituberculatus]
MERPDAWLEVMQPKCASLSLPFSVSYISFLFRSASREQYVHSSLMPHQPATDGMQVAKRKEKKSDAAVLSLVVYCDPCMCRAVLWRRYREENSRLTTAALLGLREAIHNRCFSLPRIIRKLFRVTY